MGRADGKDSMMDLTITIPGQPVPKGRPRFARRGRKVVTHTPKRTLDAEAWVAECARRVYDGEPLTGPLRLDVVFVLKRPGRLKPCRHPDGLVWAPKRPDVDNLRKLLLDGLSALWGDDAQVVDGRSVKVYAERGCPPRTVVRVQPAGDVPAWARDLADESLAAMA